MSVGGWFGGTNRRKLSQLTDNRKDPHGVPLFRDLLLIQTTLFHGVLKNYTDSHRPHTLSLTQKKIIGRTLEKHQKCRSTLPGPLPPPAKCSHTEASNGVVKGSSAPTLLVCRRQLGKLFFNTLSSGLWTFRVARIVHNAGRCAFKGGLHQRCILFRTRQKWLIEAQR